MEKSSKTFFSAKNIAILGVLTAIVLICQLVIGQFKVGATAFSVVLIPITLGALLLGIGGGAFLGFIFGLVVLICGITGADPFTNILFTAQPVATSALCIVKGVASGVVPAVIFKLFSGKNEKLGTILASAAAPIANTGLFILGMLAFQSFYNVSLAEAGLISDSTSLVYFVIIVCAGINFIVEFLVNLIASGAIYTVIRVLDKNISH